MEINLDKKAIEEAVVKAIAESAIGKRVEESINQAFVKGVYDRESVMDAAIKQEVVVAVQKAVKTAVESRASEIEALIKPMLTEEILTKLTNAAFQCVYDKACS